MMPHSFNLLISFIVTLFYNQYAWKGIVRMFCQTSHYVLIIFFFYKEKLLPKEYSKHELISMCNEHFHFIRTLTGCDINLGCKMDYIVRAPLSIITQERRHIPKLGGYCL